MNRIKANQEDCVLVKLVRASLESQRTNIINWKWKHIQTHVEPFVVLTVHTFALMCQSQRFSLKYSAADSLSISQRR